MLACDQLPDVSRARTLNVYPVEALNPVTSFKVVLVLPSEVAPRNTS
jgi:hypothetical protein